MVCQILIVDDHRFAREALSGLINSQRGFEVIGEAGTGPEGLQQALKLKPEVVLMDVNLPVMNGIDTTERILEVLPDTKIVAFSQQKSPQCVRHMIQSGASGYICKEDGIEEVVKALNSALEGRPYMSASVSALALTDYFHVVKGEVPVRETSNLTQRESEILVLITDGMSSREIAEALGISQKTVDNHRHRIMEKLNIHTIAELTKWAIREGLAVI